MYYLRAGLCIIAVIGSDVDLFIECMSHQYFFLRVCDLSESNLSHNQQVNNNISTLFSKTDAFNFRSISHRDSVTRLELECRTNLVIQRCSKHLLPLLVRRSNKKNRIRH